MTGSVEADVRRLLAVDALLPVDRRATAPVADSGLWHRFAGDVLPLVDVAELVGATSVGLDAVRARAAKHAADGSTLHDIGVRADVGVVDAGSRTFAYAALCNWDPLADPDPRDAVLLAMRGIGASLRSAGAC